MVPIGLSIRPLYIQRGLKWHEIEEGGQNWNLKDFHLLLLKEFHCANAVQRFTFFIPNSDAQIEPEANHLSDMCLNAKSNYYMQLYNCTEHLDFFATKDATFS